MDNVRSSRLMMPGDRLACHNHIAVSIPDHLDTTPNEWIQDLEVVFPPWRDLQRWLGCCTLAVRDIIRRDNSYPAKKLCVRIVRGLRRSCIGTWTTSPEPIASYVTLIDLCPTKVKFTYEGNDLICVRLAEVTLRRLEGCLAGAKRSPLHKSSLRSFPSARHSFGTSTPTAANRYCPEHFGLQ